MIASDFIDKQELPFRYMSKYIDEQSKVRYITEFHKEYLGVETLFFEYGFLTYSICDDSLFILDAFVTKKQRGKGIATSQILMLANKLKSRFIRIKIAKDNDNKEYSIRVLESNGMVLETETEDSLIYIKRHYV